MVAVDTVHALYAKLDNRPGALDHLARTLAEVRVNVGALSVETVGSTAFVRFMASRPQDTLDALRRAGVEAYASEVVVTSLPNRAGQLARATGELAAAGLNVEAVLTTADKRLAFRTSDNEVAAQVLAKL